MSSSPPTKTTLLPSLEEEPLECAICTLPYSAMHPPTITPCRHMFGAECLSTWIETDTGRNTCPYCRSILFDLEPEEPNGWEGRQLPPELDEEDGDAPWLFPPLTPGGNWRVGTVDQMGPLPEFILDAFLGDDATWSLGPAVDEGEEEEEGEVRLSWDDQEWFSAVNREEVDGEEEPDWEVGIEIEEDPVEDEVEAAAEVELAVGAEMGVEDDSHKAFLREMRGMLQKL